MRANNHDFVNKLHVILGLIQMKKYDEAVEYIMNVSMVQKEIISTIIKQIKIPSIAALLIGKFARASELGIHFALDSASSLEENDTRIRCFYNSAWKFNRKCDGFTKFNRCFQ